jgi:hypothetical protein
MNPLTFTLINQEVDYELFERLVQAGANPKGNLIEINSDGLCILTTILGNITTKY